MQDIKPAPNEKLLSVLLSFWQARTIGLITELGLPDILAKGPLHVDELAKQTNTNSSALFRVLRALESIGIFSQSSPHIFMNTATSDILRKDVTGSQRALVLHNLSRGHGPYEAWDNLGYSIKTGKPSIEEIYGCSYFELCRRNRQAGEAMSAAMRSAGTTMAVAATAAYDWSQFPVIVDVGGGVGTQIAAILDAFPVCKGVLFDQPQVVSEAIIHDRLTSISGNFFESIPANGDAYLLRWILHDWADPEAAKILHTLRRFMKPTARLVVIESVIPEENTFNFGKWTDLQMLVVTDGRERTEAEFRHLFATCGFEFEKIVPTNSPLALIIAKPEN